MTTQKHAWFPALRKGHERAGSPEPEGKALVKASAEPAASRPRIHRRPPPADADVRRVPARPPSRIPAKGPAEQARATLAGVTSWIYQRQDVRIPEIAAAPCDVAVVDLSPDGSTELAFTRDQVERMQGLDGGVRKRVLAALSIGQAEAGRFYWRGEWVRNGALAAAAPKWLAGIDPYGWNDRVHVRYWDPGWQDILIGRGDSCLDRAIEAGFDGVYLEGLEAFTYWQDITRGREQRTSAAADMVALVEKIAAYAWSERGRSQFAIVIQNPGALLEHDALRNVVSAVAQEDLLFRMIPASDGLPAVEQRTEAEIRAMLAQLRLAQQDGLPVLAVEYLMDRAEDRANTEAAAELMRQLDLVPHFTVRDLHRLMPASLSVAGRIAGAR
jgi:cysteinyl-tRNA synthetase